MASHSKDEAQLEKEHLPWSNAGVILTNWVQRSAAYLALANLERNLSYGASESEQLEPFVRAGALAVNIN